MARLILVLALLILAVVFSAQNAAPVSVSFLTWRFDSSLAIVIAFSVLVGMLAGGVIVGIGNIRRSIKREHDKKGDKST